MPCVTITVRKEAAPPEEVAPTAPTIEQYLPYIAIFVVLLFLFLAIARR